MCPRGISGETSRHDLGTSVRQRIASHPLRVAPTASTLATMTGTVFLLFLVGFAAAGFVLGLHDQNAFATVAGGITFLLGIPLTLGGPTMTDTLGCKVPIRPPDADPLGLGFDIPYTGPTYEEQEATYDQCVAFYNLFGTQLLFMAAVGAVGIIAGNIARSNRSAA
jgi:hypothetical protein